MRPARSRRWRRSRQAGSGRTGASSAYLWPEPGRAIGAVACAALAGGWGIPGAAVGELGVVVALSTAGVLVVALAVVVKNTMANVAGSALVGLGFILSQLGRPLEVVVPAAVGVLLFTSVELAWWSGQLATRTAWSRQVDRERWAQLALLVFGGGGLAVLVGVAGISGLGAGPALLLLGTVGAVLLALALALAARQAAQAPPEQQAARAPPEQ